MAVQNNKAAWTAMQSMISALGMVTNCIIGEPRSEMQDGTVAIIPSDGDVPETVLDAPRETHRVILRMYRNWLAQPQENVEFSLDEFRAEIEADFFGDFTLGGEVAYALPTEFAWQYDEDKVENTQYRIIDIVIGYRIDDRATFAV